MKKLRSLTKLSGGDTQEPISKGTRILTSTSFERVGAYLFGSYTRDPGGLTRNRDYASDDGELVQPLRLGKQRVRGTSVDALSVS